MKKNKIPLMISLIIGIIVTFYYSTDYIKANDLQENIATKIIRFHVIAHSDSQEDQSLKMKVKEAVLKYISPILSNSKDITETRKLLTDNTDAIVSIAQDTIIQNGYNYTVKASLTNCYFPTKTYGDVTFPPGDYEAYKIEIGNSCGSNWWCVMYPPLCFIDASHGILPDSSKNTLKNILNDEEYDSITINNYSDKQIKFKFKYLTFLNKLL